MDVRRQGLRLSLLRPEANVFYGADVANLKAATLGYIPGIPLLRSSSKTDLQTRSPPNHANPS